MTYSFPLPVVFFVFLVNFPLLGSPQTELNRHAKQFSSQLAMQMSELLYEAAAIDPVTRKERLELKNHLMKRQKELRSWLRNRGQKVRLEDCTTEVERQNYLEFRNVMASQEFLRLPYPRRIRFISRINGYFDDFRNAFPMSLNDMIFQTPWRSDWSRDGFITNLLQRLQERVKLQIRHFNTSQFMSVGAVYVQDVGTIFLNLNSLIESSVEFIDAFEHELWHHLLPPNGVDGLYENLWLEGFTEAVSEIWSEEFYRKHSGYTLPKLISIQYPVQTGFASLCLGLNRELTLAFLGDAITRESFLRQLSTGTAAVSTDSELVDSAHNFPPLGSGLASSQSGIAVKTDRSSAVVLKKNWEFLSRASVYFFEYSTIINRERKSLIEQILRDWGWKEDDYRPVNISRFIKDGYLSKTALSRAFLTEKQFLMDFVKVVTMLNLQKIEQVLADREILEQMRLPESLKDNLIRVSRLSRNSKR